MQHADPRQILQQYWGYSDFRPLQEDIILSALGGRDTLALLPTGGGKSICYQVPALCQEGLCIVISPLIALMKDQVDNLKSRGIPAAAVYSGMNHRAIDITLENACNGAYKLLYVSPERLFSDMMQARLGRMSTSLIAVDEAHCISQWGYDFRPPYLKIAELRPLFGNAPILALTATATAEVVKDIQEKLAFKAENVFQQSFQRSNLSYSVLYEERKKEKLVNILSKVPGSGIVYMRSRGETKEIALWLKKHRINADFYHAGLSTEERSAKQQAWMEGKTRVMVCTNAFGMGIDKPDVRMVVHLSLPDTQEAYFQEAGRAGRDGKKAYAVLLYTPADAENLKRFLENSYPPLDFLKKVYRSLCHYTQVAVGAGLGESYDFDLQHFCSTYKLPVPTTHAALRLLETDGWIAVSENAAAPARAYIRASREALYDYQLRNRQADVLTKAMLRAYPGVQQDFVNISEQLLAKLCHTNQAAVQQVLETARQEGMLEYFPANTKPQIIFLKERASDENVQIDMERYRFRKDRAQQKAEQAIQYASQLLCRSRQLLAYFGETESEDCGICDVCTGRNKPHVSEDAIAIMSKKIKSVLADGPLPLDEIFAAFAPKRQELLAQTIQYMLDEGVLKETEDGIGMRDEG